MSDVNLVILQGRLTRTPETRKTSSGVNVTDLSVASNRYRKQVTGDGFDKDTTFTKVTLWNQMAERYAAQLKQGDMVMVTGQLVDDSYEKDGVKHNGRLKVDNVSQLNVLAKAKLKTETTGESAETPEV